MSDVINNDNISNTKMYHFLVIFFVAILEAFNYEIFILHNDFVSAGLNGICIIIQHVFGFSFGYFSLILNIPLIFISAFLLKKDYCYKTFLFVMVFSITSILIKNSGLVAPVVFKANDVGDKIMAAIFGGIVNGFVYSLALRLGGCTGGMDVVASMVNAKHPEYSIVWIIFAINAVVAVLSFFAFDNNYTPVMLCLIYSFVTSKVDEEILHGRKSAIKFEIIMENPQELADDILKNLKHGCTMMHATGMYSGEEKAVLVCVVNKLQIASFERLLKKYPSAFVIVSPVSSTYGNFKRIR